MMAVPETSSSFSEAIRTAGLMPPDVIGPGKVCRFPGEGKRNGNKAGWCRLFDDGLGGCFGDWSTDLFEVWRAKRDKPYSQAETKAYRLQVKEAQAQRQKNLAEAHRLAAIEAQRILDSSTPAQPEHPYLARKGVQVHGIQKQDNDLIIPVRVAGELSSIQRIKPDGSKRFQSGGKITGGYFIIGTIKGAKTLCIAEGFATGATIHEATGYPVAVAFNAGNLEPVAGALRQKLPEMPMIICADDDVTTEGNPGITKANMAAQAIGAKVAVPAFGNQRPEGVTDFNDMAALGGLEAVRDEIERQIAVVDPETAKTGNTFTCPTGYLCGVGGVFINPEDKEPERITHKPVWIVALSRDGSRENWGRLARWVDSDGGEHERAIPAQLFHANGNELAQELAAAGLPIIPGKERRLLQYLAAFAPAARLIAAPATGWHGQAFVLPDYTINEPENERIIYQAAEYQNAGCISTQGTLEDWQSLMRNVSQMVKFAVACAFAAPLRYRTNTAAGGFHFYGRTSQGKTTMLQAASSVWGNGCDPAMAGGADAYIQRWNATKNGLEGMASSFNDLPLVIDEVGEGDERDFGRIVYQLMSGTGKQRANRAGGMRERRTWRNLLLSSGEVPVSDFIQNARGGQLVRLIDIEAKDMFAGREEADAMKKGCGEVYGVAGRDLIGSGNLLDGWDTMTAESIGDAPTPEAGRVRDRFRLVAHAGELAIKRGILPWNQGDVLAACKSVFANWKQTGHAVSDAERGIDNVRAFLMAFGSSRFEHDDDRKREPIDRAGIFRDSIYHFTPAAFKEACGGVLADAVKRALDSAEMLHVSEVGKFVSKVRIDGMLTRVVSVKATILSDFEKSAGDTGDTGHTSRGTRAKPVPPAESGQGTQGTAGEGVPPVPSAKTQQGTAESYMPQGVCPVSPLSHHENTKSEKVTDDEPDEFDAAPEPEPLSELSPDEETRIRAWLTRIGGIGPSMIAAALEECRTDSDTRRDYLERSEEVTEVPK